MNKVPFNSFANPDFQYDCNWFDEGWEEETMQNLAVILKEMDLL